MQFHTPTIFLTLSFLYIMLPVAVWLALFNQKSKTIVLWCVGGELLAIGLLFFGLRSLVPAWVSYPLANAITWLAILIQSLALRRYLGLTWRPLTMVLVVLVWTVVFEYFRVVFVNPHLRFSWSLLLFTVIFFYISYLAWRIARTYDLKSGRLLSVVYAIASALMCIRLLRVVIGLTEPDVVAQGVDSLLIVLSSFISSVLGTFAFVATEQRVRQEENSRLSEQISQLERQRTMGAMSYSFAHELSQPMTAILMDTHTLKSGLASGQFNVKDMRESIDDIERNANRTAQLIGRIRNFMRPSSSDFETVDMKLLAQDVKQLLLHDIQMHNITFEWDVDHDACVVVGDKIQLSQIVLNVYRNAIQALVDSSVKKISVSLDKQDDRVVLRVRDSGPGLAESLKHQVGQPFVSSKTDGLGVGLSISKTIAEKHSGSLTITNAMDGGAIVELNLPAAHA
jgi:signal transduction histidine kinase